MWQSGERIRHRAATEYKGKTGTLYLTDRRLAWVAQGANAVTVSADFPRIVSNQVSKPGARRIMLKVRLDQPVNEETSFTFAFVSPNTATAEREKFKDGLAHILSQQRATESAVPSSSTGVLVPPKSILSQKPLLGSPAPVPSTGESPSSSGSALTPKLLPYTASTQSPPLTRQEINARKQVLKKNQELADLHRELVQGGYIHEEEFWATRRHILASELAQLELRKGQPSAWLEMIPAQGGQGFTYTLNKDKMYHIFQLHPKVRQAYQDNVPHKLSENEFWKRFLVSKLFHRDRSSTSFTGPSDELFDQCLEEEEQEASERLAQRLELDKLHRFLDFSRTTEDHIETGNAPNVAMQPGHVEESRSLIKSFNRHSERVLRASLDTSAVTAIDNDEEALEFLEDLQVNQSHPVIPLEIANQQCYLESQGLSLADDSSDAAVPFDATGKTMGNFLERLDGTNFNLFDNPVNGETTSAALQELWSLIRHNASIQQARNHHTLALPEELRQVVTTCHVMGFEILRHLWASISLPLTETKLNRAAKINDALLLVQKNIQDTLKRATSESSDSQRTMNGVLEPLLASIAKGQAEFRKVNSLR
ncbi:RNA polymerase II transcription factor B subunit 1 [Dispira parvispora]|uniref:RNA polymerase II transcription factor B subunit 1 n=1 Tax=Dispira parvispora TaxID=1520584 RepID=A0A9W8AUG4_9FUNG|nr:RNA polymerase II transcription factor B subunit 1 [Dispira parvispora]